MIHHCPTEKVIHPIYRGHPLNSCFVSNLEHLCTDSVKLWASGHSHKRMSEEVNSLWYGLNPRGYPGENKTFIPMLFSLFKGGGMKLIT